MTNLSYGMQFGPTDALRAPDYSTLQERLQINLNNLLGKQFDVKTITAGTAINIDLTDVETISEQLLVITHGLGYVPQTYAVFSLIPKSSTETPSELGYTEEEVLLSEGGSGQDYISYTIDKDTFTVLHYVTSNGTGTGDYTSSANTYNVQVKYLICNNTKIRTTNFY